MIRGAGALSRKLKELAELKDLQRAVKVNTSELENKAKRNTNMFKNPTGNLKRNITLSLEDGGLTGKVKAETEYAAYVEYGTRFQSAQPYMRNAIADVGPRFSQDLARLFR